MSRKNAIGELAFIASSQRGYVTRAQAEVAAVDDNQLGRLTRSGVLARVDRGVYRFAGAPEHPHERLWVAWLRLDPDRFVVDRQRDPHAWLSHAAAAEVWGLGDLPSSHVDFIVDRRLQSSRDAVRFHRRSGGLDPGEWTVVEDLPVTAPHRLITDLAASQVDGGHLARIVVEAIREGHTDAEQLGRALEPEAWRYGCSTGAELVDFLVAIDNTEAAA